MSLRLQSESQARQDYGETPSQKVGRGHQVQGVYHGDGSSEYGAVNQGTHALLAGWNSSQECKSLYTEATNAATSSLHTVSSLSAP